MRPSKYEALMPQMVRHLGHVYARRSEWDELNGSLWYESAQCFATSLARETDTPLGVVAAVIAALSPQCDWYRNQLAASNVLRREPVAWGPLPASVRKAQQLRDAQSSDTRTVFKSGPKVHAFSRNIAGDLHPVTVDTHALQAAYDDVTVNVTLNARTYDIFARTYQQAATRARLEPAVFQAIVWHIWKRENPPADKRLQRRKD